MRNLLMIVLAAMLCVPAAWGDIAGGPGVPVFGSSWGIGGFGDNDGYARPFAYLTFRLTSGVLFEGVANFSVLGWSGGASNSGSDAWAMGPGVSNNTLWFTPWFVGNTPVDTSFYWTAWDANQGLLGSYKFWWKPGGQWGYTELFKGEAGTFASYNVPVPEPVLYGDLLLGMGVVLPFLFVRRRKA